MGLYLGDIGSQKTSERRVLVTPTPISSKSKIEKTRPLRLYLTNLYFAIALKTNELFDISLGNYILAFMVPEKN